MDCPQSDFMTNLNEVSFYDFIRNKSRMRSGYSVYEL